MACVDCSGEVGGKPHPLKVRCRSCQTKHRSGTERRSRMRAAGKLAPKRERLPYASQRLMAAMTDYVDISDAEIDAIVAASVRRQRWEAAQA